MTTWHKIKKILGWILFFLGIPLALSSLWAIFFLAQYTYIVGFIINVVLICCGWGLAHPKRAEEIAMRERERDDKEKGVL